MAIKTITQPPFVVDTEAEKDITWPDKCLVYALDTNKFYQLLSGVFVNIKVPYSSLIGTPTIPSTFDNLTDGTTNKAYTGTEKTKLAGIATGATVNDTDANLKNRANHTGTQGSGTVTGLATVSTSGSYTDLSNKPTIPIVTRTTSVITPSLVGTGATGTQVSSTKDSTVSLSVSTSTTSTIGGPSNSVITLKKCATNNVTEGSWTTVAILENDQTITLALTLNSAQVIKGQLCTDLPAGWYYKLVNSGSGTHSELALTGEQTIYG